MNQQQRLKIETAICNGIEEAMGPIWEEGEIDISWWPENLSGRLAAMCAEAIELCAEGQDEWEAERPDDG